MIKLILLLVSLNFSGCTAAPDLRPDLYSDADNLLALGIEAYKKDHYHQAKKHFLQAIALYQSVADQINIYKARLNLANTLLAYSDFSAAKIQIALLKQLTTEGLFNAKLLQRLVLLEVKFYFSQQDYATALEVIKPLLSKSPPKLTILATVARLDILNSAATNRYWMTQFEQALAKMTFKPIKQQRVLTRLLAYITFKKKDYEQTEILLNQLLIDYQNLANRRGIADCLEKLAELAIARKNQPQAIKQWHKALKIRLWLKDVYKANKIRRLLKNLQH